MSQPDNNNALDPDLATDTRLAQAGYSAPGSFESLVAPIHHASTVVFPSLAEMRARNWERDDVYTYGLHGTPTTRELEDRLADIEGGQFCVLAPSGLAAISMIDFAFLKSGDELLLPHNVYAPSRELARTLLADLGIVTRYYDPLDAAALALLLTPATRLVWLESPGSVTMEVADLRGLVAQVAAANARRPAAERIVTAIDNTWAAGLALKPFDLGIDISMQALTKYQSGGSDVLMGAAITREQALHLRIKTSHMRTGLGVGADDAWLVLRGLKSLPVRHAQHDRAGRELAGWLAARPEVKRVLHPALPGCPGHEFWQRDFSGAGGLFSVIFDERYSTAQVERFVEALRLFPLGYSWGGASSLSMVYAPSRTAWVKEKGAIVRFNVGLEAVGDLVADVERALRVLA
ncbi:cystathionine beta-lyase [Derxia gummosa]|uniref:Cystathionine beta-lyase n=1 Tax=Derxia gummosa DSM 723 TaxID=1121388 RepID=A0A8B6X8G3_9BURK|nr:cystathionine beta-lyase [Derxia gummosa]